MSNESKIVIYDATTGEITEREFSEKELADRDLTISDSVAWQKTQDDKDTARKSALAKLAALGLTADEVAAL